MGLDTWALLPNTLETSETGRKTVMDERRRQARAKVRWTLYFATPGSSELIPTITHDLSCQGFYCIASGGFIPGETRDCTLMIPYTGRSGGFSALVCRVRVIRVEVLGDGGLCGVGCAIEEYHFTSSHPKSSKPTIFCQERVS